LKMKKIMLLFKIKNIVKTNIISYTALAVCGFVFGYSVKTLQKDAGLNLDGLDHFAQVVMTIATIGAGYFAFKAFKYQRAEYHDIRQLHYFTFFKERFNEKFLNEFVETLDIPNKIGSLLEHDHRIRILTMCACRINSISEFYYKRFTNEVIKEQSLYYIYNVGKCYDGTSTFNRIELNFKTLYDWYYDENHKSFKADITDADRNRVNKHKDAIKKAHDFLEDISRTSEKQT